MAEGIKSLIKLVVHLKGQLTQLIFRASPAGPSPSKGHIEQIIKWLYPLYGR